MKPNYEKTLIFPQIAKKPCYYVVGIKEKHNLTEGLIPTAAQQWERFMSRIHEIDGRGAVTVGVCLSRSGDEALDYMTGTCMNYDPAAIPDGMIKIILEPQTYAIFTHNGPISDLPSTFRHIDRWLNENGSHTRTAAPDFEYYDERYTGMEQSGSQFEIYIPVNNVHTN